MPEGDPIAARFASVFCLVLGIGCLSDSPMLGYAVNGDPALMTMWRGVPGSVSADGRTEPTAAVPDVAATKDPVGLAHSQYRRRALRPGGEVLGRPASGGRTGLAVTRPRRGITCRAAARVTRRSPVSR